MKSRLAQIIGPVILLAYAAATVFAASWEHAALLANIDLSFIDEASGIADSSVNPGIIWLHNDSGDGAYLYAVDRKGKLADVILVRSAAANDWEDMSRGPGPDGKGSYLYIADCGDNTRDRCEVVIYRIPEPKVSATPGSKEKPSLSIEPTIARRCVYPDGPHDAEALLVHPRTGILYIVTKDSKKTSVYRIPPETPKFWEINKMEKVADIKLPETSLLGPVVTGGDIAPDGRSAALRTYLSAYEFTLPDGISDFDEIWKSKPVEIEMPAMAQGETICYSVSGDSLLATSEKLPAPIYELKKKR